jgi:hypothetical protein
VSQTAKRPVAFPKDPLGVSTSQALGRFIGGADSGPCVGHGALSGEAVDAKAVLKSAGHRASSHDGPVCPKQTHEACQLEEAT